MIKVSWSPQFCLMTRKTNVNLLYNNKIPLAERLVTFEGPEYLSQTDSISSPILSSDLEQICLNIVKHIQEVSGGNIQISRMNLFFKIDDKNRIWLLFCSGIKVREKFLSKEEKLATTLKRGERVTSPVFTYAARKIDKDAVMRSKSNPLLGKRFCANCESFFELFNQRNVKCMK